jgi:hypothetical protein
MKPENFLSKRFDAYDSDTKTYHTIRDAGLYANLCWIVRKVCLLEMWGYKVENINFILHEYIPRVSAYNFLFFKSEIQTSLENLSDDEKLNFYNQSESSYVGFGNDLRQLNFQITNPIISKFFNPSKEVMTWYNRFISQIGGNVNDIIFIWARRTDKVSESKLPDVKNYLDVLSTIDTNNKKIVVQTDDISVLKNFEKNGLKFYTFKEIPLPKIPHTPFHINLNGMSEEMFLKNYRINKVDYLRQMLALSIVGKNAYKTILYPGNPSTYIPLLKGTLQDCLLFKDDLNLF